MANKFKNPLEQSHSEKAFDQLSLIDDPLWMAALKDNPEAAEEIIRPLIGNPNLSVKKVSFRESFTAPGDSPIVDIAALDQNNKLAIIEVQKRPEGFSPAEAQLHRSFVDQSLIDAGVCEESLPDLYMIFLSEKDTQKHGSQSQPIYRYKTLNCSDPEQEFGDGVTYIYSHWDNPDVSTELGRLLHDLKCSNPDQMQNPKLASTVRFLKNTHEGKELLQTFENNWKSQLSKQPLQKEQKDH